MELADHFGGFSEPLPFTRDAMAQAPTGGGVHVVCEPDGTVLYVGRTGALRTRMRQHLTGDREASVLHDQIGQLLDAAGEDGTAAGVAAWLGRRQVRWLETSRAAEVKDELVARLSPRFNRAKSSGRPGRGGPDFAPLARWGARLAQCVDLDHEERQYKLELSARLTAARQALQAGDPDWPRLLKRSFGPPNNLTSWRAHGSLLQWFVEYSETAAEALQLLWAPETSPAAAVDAFCQRLPENIPRPGTAINLASFLLGAVDVTQLPVYRVTLFEQARRLTGWTTPTGTSGTQYADALEFLDAFSRAVVAAGGPALRDRLDAQGLLWQVLTAGPHPTWNDDEKRAYRRFLKGRSVDDLSELVAEFRETTDYPAVRRTQRDTERLELTEGLTSEALAEPDLALLRRLAGPAYGSPGPQPGFNRLLKDENDLQRVLDMLRYLLYGEDELAERLDACISGQHKLPGVGEAMPVKALAVSDPERWIPCYVTNGPVGKRRILELLGAAVPDGLSPGAAAAATNDLLRERLEPHFPEDPWGMQEFSWWLLHRDHVPATQLKSLADELFLPEDFLDRVLRLADDRGQVVLYGPPGTGKTYVARKLAGHVARGGGTVEKVQFHPSYAYEDFVEGYRPKVVDKQMTYEVVDGPLKRIAAAAQQRKDVVHVLLIDELNRANVPKVLGELLFLLEYRDEEITLQYSETAFSLPDNLQIIATMNTADRSVALVDAALRRRFHFVPFFPDVAPIDGLLRRWLGAHQPQLLWVADVVDRANRLLDDRNLAIGPSHFLKRGLDEDGVRLAWEHSVLPFLEEYFFSDPSRLEEFALDRLRQPPDTAQVEPPAP
ncbi:MAG: AAA family ATPase [Mycobacteriales bacterium]